MFQSLLVVRIDRLTPISGIRRGSAGDEMCRVDAGRTSGMRGRELCARQVIRLDEWGHDVIEILDRATAPCASDAGLMYQLDHAFTTPADLSLAAIAYAAFFTEAERDEIGDFDELPAPEQARWQSVAAHIARTVVSPVDEDLGEWRAEQEAVLAEQVRVAPYSRELWRAITRTTSMQQQIASLKDLLIASRACIATACSHSQRLAHSAQALDNPIWSSYSGTDQRGSDPTDATPLDHANGAGSPDQPYDGSHFDGSARYHDGFVRRV